MTVVIYFDVLLMATLHALQALRPSLMRPVAQHWACCLLVGTLLSSASTAQNVGQYSFSQSVGSYSHLSGATVLISGTQWNNQRFTVPLPQPFLFAGQSYTTMYVTANGFITFGGMMGVTEFTPLSSGAGYARAISPFGANLQDANLATSSVSWKFVGSEIVVQWRDARRKVVFNTESFSVQARMNTSTGVIQFIYSAVTNQSSNTNQQPQVGLRGPNNSFPTNVNNRQVVAGPFNWTTSQAGSSNNSRCRFTSAAPAQAPVSGLIYTFTPPCVLASAVITGPILCAGGQASVAVSGTGGMTPYSGTGTFMRPAGPHSFTVTDALGCSSVASVNVGEPSPLAISATITTPIACFGGDAWVNVSAAGGTTPCSGTGAFLRPTLTHLFTVSDANGCLASTSLFIPQPPLLQVSASVVSVETACGSSDATVQVTATGGTPGYSGDGPHNGLTAGATAFFINDANGCSANTTLDIPQPDSDADGTVDCSDECPTDPNKVLSGQCGCDVADTDTDADGTADCVDNCPNDPAKVDPGACGCGTPDMDSDGDSYMDCVDFCPADPLKIGPGICGCGSPDTDTDGDGTLDCLDTCPYGPDPGTACDDGDADTAGDIVGSDCVCQGTTTAPSLIFSLTTDGQGSETSWEITPAGGGPPVCSGSGYAPNSSFDIPCPVIDGSYKLHVMDSAGDGLCCVNGPGGYVLHMSDGRRIIDNAGDGSFASVSTVTAGFTLPLGADRLTPSRCDREDLLPNDFIQAIPNPDVRAQFGENDANSGYQFWIFDPDGGYSRRCLLTHANACYLFPGGEDRCSYLRLCELVTNPIPHNKLLNVRVRSMVNGAYSAFGPACRMRIDLPGSCPATQLIDDISDPHHSCGLENVMLDGSRMLYAVPVSAATDYQFEFVCGGYIRRIRSTGSSLLLNEWATQPLEYGGKNYQVRVRVSFDNMVTWCPFGPVCAMTTMFAPPGEERSATIVGSAPADLRIWPNPMLDGSLNVILQGLSAAETSAHLSMIDLQGRSIVDTDVATPDGILYAQFTSDNPLGAGIYLLTIQAGHRSWTERIIVE